jgi:hypothetical protein
LAPAVNISSMITIIANVQPLIASSATEGAAGVCAATAPMPGVAPLCGRLDRPPPIYTASHGGLHHNEFTLAPRRRAVS